MKNNGFVERWLNCHVDKGMFSDEAAISYPPDVSKEKTRKSVFVSSKYVKVKQPGFGSVRVKVYKGGPRSVVILPTSRRDMLTVSESDLTE